MEFAMGHVH